MMSYLSHTVPFVQKVPGIPPPTLCFRAGIYRTKHAKTRWPRSKTNAAVVVVVVVVVGLESCFMYDKWGHGGIFVKQYLHCQLKQNLPNKNNDNKK